MSGRIEEISMVLSSETFTLQSHRSFFSKNLTRSGKIYHVGLNQVLPNRVSETSFYTFEDIDLREFHAKIHKKLSETLGAMQRYTKN